MRPGRRRFAALWGAIAGCWAHAVTWSGMQESVVIDQLSVRRGAVGSLLVRHWLRGLQQGEGLCLYAGGVATLIPTPLPRFTAARG